MGHIRLGVLPKSGKWQRVVEQLRLGADAADVAGFVAGAAETSLKSASNDPAFLHAFWLLTQIPLAAHGPAFAEDLRRLGLEVSDQPSLMDVAAAFSAAADRYIRQRGGRTDLGEMAHLAAVETATVGSTLPFLFGPTADSAISHGGKTDSHLGAMWRRKLRFVVPVRQPGLWSSDPVTTVFVETIRFLSDDDYEFEFRPLKTLLAMETYSPLSGASDAKFAPDEVMLFSCGLVSFAGTVQEVVAHGKRVALVGHRSDSKITEAQNYLIGQLRRRFGTDRVLHVPVRANLKDDLGKKPTHRTRSFLFTMIGAVTGHLLDRLRMFFFENGVVILNLSPVGQVVGARATRTTHPQALSGFRRILSAVLRQPFDVSNPYAWITKSEVIERIVQGGCVDLIRHTRSCTRELRAALAAGDG